MKILVTGGTGTVGSQVVNELLKRDVVVTVLTRKSKQEANLPKGVTHLKGDLLDPQTVSKMCQNQDAIFLINAVSPTEAHEGLMAVNGAQIGDVQKIVYLSIHNVDQAPHLPHFGAKLPIETAIKASGIPYTILRANNFIQIDYWAKDALLKYGVYPHPLGDVGLSRVDIRDIAEAAAITLTNDRYKQEVFNLVGPDIHTGQSSTEIWSKTLQKDIFYGGNNLDAWEKQSQEFMPGWMLFDFKLMFEFFQQEGLKATKKDIRRLTALLEHPPRSLENFARETAEIWKKEGVLKK